MIEIAKPILYIAINSFLIVFGTVAIYLIALTIHNKATKVCPDIDLYILVTIFGILIYILNPLNL